MAKTMKELRPFLGVVTSIDPRSIQPFQAADSLNVLLEDGALRPRLGFRSVVSNQTGFTAGYGARYVQGYDSNNATVEEYVTFEHLGVAVRPYSRVVANGTPTEITNGGSSVSLHASDWVGFTWQDRSYWINPNETNSIWRHYVGCATSFTPLAIPAAPTVALTATKLYGGGSQGYNQTSFAGMDPSNSTHITVSSNVQQNVSELDGSSQIQLIHKYGSSGRGDTTVTIDLNYATASIQDWTYNDIFAFSLASPIGSFNIDPDSTKVHFINNDGSPVTIYPDDIQRNTIFSAHSRQWVFRAEFKNKTRADWDNIRKIVISYNVISTASGNNTTISNQSSNRMTIAKPVVGGVDMRPPSERLHGQDRGLTWAYGYYYSTQDLASGPAGEIYLDEAFIRGSSPYAGLDPLGTWIRLTATASADVNVDKLRFYVEVPAVNGNPEWALATTQNDSTLTYTYHSTFAEALLFDRYKASEFRLGGARCGCGWKGWAVWGFSGGYQNVRHSWVADPEKLYNDADGDILNSETAAGRNFSLADNNADEPQAMHAVGNALVIMGKAGVHAQIATGDGPQQVTPPKRLPGSFGIINHLASCVWKTDAGVPGVAWVGTHLEGVYFAAVSETFDGDNGFAVTELTAPIRGLLRSFLLDDQSALWTALSLTEESDKTDLIRIAVDPAKDALWVILGQRALVLRRPTAVDGARYWEPYSFTMPSGVYWKYEAFSELHRMRALRSSGVFDEIEWNSAAEAYIASSSTSDAGSAPPAGYWTSRIMVGENRRVDHFGAQRDDITDQPTLLVTSTRQNSGTLTWANGSRFLRGGALQTGWEHQFKIGVPAGIDPIRAFTWEESYGGKRWLA